MAESCLLGLQGKDNIYECAYVESSLIPELSYFASKVRSRICAGKHMQQPTCVGAKHICACLMWCAAARKARTYDLPSAARC